VEGRATAKTAKADHDAIVIAGHGIILDIE
jgi:hypothetical protein